MEAVGDIQTYRIQIIGIIVSIVTFLYILSLIRNKKLKEEYSMIWLAFSIVFIFFSVWRGGLDYFAQLIGVVYPPAAVFLLMLSAVFVILIQFSIIISKLSNNNKNLIQEIGIMKHEMEELKKKVEGE